MFSEKKYKKGEYRDQFIIAYISDFQNYEDIVQWACFFAQKLQKGVILLHISDGKYTSISTTQAQQKLKQISDNINLTLFHSYAALSGKTKDVIHNLGDLLNGVMIVSKINKSMDKFNPLTVNNILSNFATSRIAYFLFSKPYDLKPFSDVVVSMNGLKECKEKVLWASYFGRFFDSVTHIFYHRYSDEYLQKQLNLNIGFLRKIFKKFNIITQNAHSLDRRTTLDVQALAYAEKNNCNLCIFQTTKNKSIFELFTGLPEKKVLNRLDTIPVLFLNQRDDLFVICE